MTSAGRDDFILVQVTSNPYSDPLAVALTEADFSRGSLERASYARPGKLFTANRALIAVEVGSLSKEAFGKIVAATVEIFEKALRERS
jgi:mRNA interferase MazF